MTRIEICGCIVNEISYAFWLRIANDSTHLQAVRCSVKVVAFVKGKATSDWS